MLLLNETVGEVRRLRKKYGEHVGRYVQPRNYGNLSGMIADGYSWMADNDAFKDFHLGRWLKMLGSIAGLPNCLFVVAPDVVGDAISTIHLFRRYAPIIRDCGLPTGFVLQDGPIGANDVGVPWNEFDALFIGGTTEWKLGPKAAQAARQAKDRGKWVHMGRVNTLRRIEYAHSIGCDSVDGMKWTQYTATYEHELSAFLHAQQGLGV